MQVWLFQNVTYKKWRNRFCSYVWWYIFISRSEGPEGVPRPRRRSRKRATDLRSAFCTLYRYRDKREPFSVCIIGVRKEYKRCWSQTKDGNQNEFIIVIAIYGYGEEEAFVFHRSFFYIDI